MKTSPFIYGTTVIDEAFVNRKDEIKKLSSNLTGGINTTLISPRRWGKSSLVEKTIADLAKDNKDIRVAMIDLFTISSSEQFMEKFTRELIKTSSSKWQEWAKNARSFFKMLIPKINMDYLLVQIPPMWPEGHRPVFLRVPAGQARKG